jgi:hypothetical protein
VGGDGEDVGLEAEGLAARGVRELGGGLDERDGVPHDLAQRGLRLGLLGVAAVGDEPGVVPAEQEIRAVAAEASQVRDVRGLCHE